MAYKIFRWIRNPFVTPPLSGRSQLGAPGEPKFFIDDNGAFFIDDNNAFFISES